MSFILNDPQRKWKLYQEARLCHFELHHLEKSLFLLEKYPLELDRLSEELLFWYLNFLFRIFDEGHLAWYLPELKVRWNDFREEQLNQDKNPNPSAERKNLLSLLLDEEHCQCIDQHEFFKEHRAFVFKENYLYLRKYAFYEATIAEALRKEFRRTSLKDHHSEESFLKTYEAFLRKNSLFPLDKQQKKAVLQALKQDFFVLSGGPGTGKTTSLIAILRGLIYQQNPQKAPLRIALSAFTALAVKRLEMSLLRGKSVPFCPEKKIDEQIPQQGKTLHALLGLIPGNSRLTYHAKNPLPYDLIIIDEASMLDIFLFEALLAAKNSTTRLILVGDPQQLPSIRTGAIFEALHRTLSNPQSSYHAHGVTLLENHRSKNPELHQLAMALRTQNKTEFEELLVKESSSYQIIEYQTSHIPLEQLAEDWSFLDPQKALISTKDPHWNAEILDAYFQELNEHIILSPLRLGIWGNEGLNHALLSLWGKKHDSHRYPVLTGLPFLISHNDRDLDIQNGERGVLVFDISKKTLFVLFTSRKSPQIPAKIIPYHLLEEKGHVSFVQTVHKSQGSEYNHLCLILPPDNHFTTQHLLYTALTRCKEQLKIYTPHREELVKIMERKTPRWSRLELLLQEDPWQGQLF